jgi:ribosome-associated protein
VTASPRALDLLKVAASAADSKQAIDLVALDVSGPLPLTDVFLIASARNERNAQAVADEIDAHVFTEEDRMYYSLERLWKDCPVVALEIEPTASAS